MSDTPDAPAPMTPEIDVQLGTVTGMIQNNTSPEPE